MRVVELSGGVGGARMARGLAALPDVELTVVVNVGDDDRIHGLHVSPDFDTVVYTLAGLEGPQGWGRESDTFVTNDELARFGVDNRFRLGDKDLALNLYRTNGLAGGAPLSDLSRQICDAFEVGASVLPATDDPLQTRVRLEDGWTSFQDYFVLRGTVDEVRELEFTGADASRPAPGVLDAISTADLVVVAPSNPPLSIWPILAIPGIREAVEAHPKVVAVSPLISGRALKGPADRVMRALGLPAGTEGVLQAYRGLLQCLVVDTSDEGDTGLSDEVSVVARETRIGSLQQATSLAEEIVRL